MSASMALAGRDAGIHIYRYRMTVFVDTPSGPRSGSSVIEIETSPPGLLSSSAFRREVRGEAVAVDLPSGTLFALLRSPFDESAAQLYAENAYDPVLPHGYDWKTGVEALKRQTAPALLPAHYFPSLVTFRKRADPKTVALVDPTDLAASFGPGSALNRIEIEITDDPVTENLGSRLPSFGPASGYDSWLSQLSYDDPRRFYLTDFRRGL